MPLIDTIGWRTTGLRNRIVDRLWERRLGVHTMGFKDIGHPDATRYATFAYTSIMKVIDHLDPQPDDVFVDMGSGKGRVLCCAAMRPIKRVIGVEVDGDLCAIARTNAEQMSGRRAPIDIINTEAQRFDYRQCTKFFVFNPFGPTTLKLVLDAIGRSCREVPRPIRFVYVNPIHEHVLQECAFLEPYDRWQRQPWSGLKFDASFWRSTRRGS